MSEGGYLVPAALAEAWHKVAIEPSPVMRVAAAHCSRVKRGRA